MDVYAGGTGALAQRLRARLGPALTSIGADHREVGSAQTSFASVWSDGTGEVTRVETDEVEVLFDGYLHNHGKATLAEHLPELARRITTQRRVLDGDESGIFNVVVREKRTGHLHLANDPGGLLPLLHTRNAHGFAFASHLYLSARALDAPPDPLGVAAMICLGYTLGPRTYFGGIERLLAGELLTYRPETGTVERSHPEVYYQRYERSGPDLTDEIWEALVSSVRPLAEAGASIGVMLSEGFDSRLIAGILVHLGVDLHTFTHATEGTAGTEIVRELSARLGSSHTFDFLPEGLPADIDDLRRQLLLADNLHIPHWSAGARHLRAQGVDATVTGFAMDSTIGAHALATPGRSDRQRVADRYREMLQQDLGRMAASDVEDRAEIQLAAAASPDEAWCTNRVRRFLAPDVAELVVPALAELPGAIAAEQARVRKGTEGLPSQVVQRMFCENRARKYSFGQEQTLRVDTKVAVPCFEPTFMRVVSKVPPAPRLHHRAYLRLLRDHLPELSRVRSGAHALPPRYPRLVLETSRFVSKAREAKLSQRYMAARGDVDVSPLRMVLFTEKTARLAPRFALEDIIDRGTGPVNGPSMQLTVDKIRRYDIRVFLPALFLGLELTEVFDEL